MRKAIVKSIAFLAVFFISLMTISFVMNQGNTDMTAEMGKATLPSMAIVKNGIDINQMYGYTMRMETAGLRESITTVDSTRQVDAAVQLYGQELEGISYELRSIDGSRLIEKTKLTGTKEGDRLNISFRLKDLMEEGEEYSLIFVAELEDGREARYYTRVIQADYGLAEKLDFVTSFSEATFDRESFTAAGYHKKLETSQEGSDTSFARVDIHSMASTVTWGELDVKREEAPQIWVREIAPQTASFVLRYPISYEEKGKKVSAQVEEYFRVRSAGGTMYLLDYERTAEQYFLESSSSFSEQGIDLGITGREIEMKESDGGTVFAFSQAGALYCYNGADGRMARLFSFYDKENSDARNRYDRHGFKILQVDETGNVSFLVYGYMNRGRHEGACGVQVCYYSSTLNVVEEMAFVPYARSAKNLEAELNCLAYANGKNDLYLMIDGSIWHIGLEDKSCTEVVSGIRDGSYQTADDNSMLAWQKNSSDNSCTSLEFMNLNSGETVEIEAGDGNYIRALGFMGEDLIYGIAKKELVAEDSVGNIVFPMHRVVIQEFGGEILKNYSGDGIYVTGCTIEENQINLERVRISGKSFVPVEADQILYNEEIPESKNYVSISTDSVLKTLISITLERGADPKKVKVLTPKEVLFEGGRDVILPDRSTEGRFYVYGPDGVEKILSDAAMAVALGDEAAGTVADDAGNYIFKRDRLHTANQIMAIKGAKAEDGRSSLAVCLDTIFQYEGLVRDSQYLLDSGKDVLEILSQNLTEQTVLNLQGCTLDMVLYYPDREIPVLAVLQDGSAVLIVGFNEQNIVLMDPGTGTVYKKGMNDARNWFEENGNRFITYW